MPRKSKFDQDAGYMRSYWDELQEAELDYGAIISLMVHPSKRPGVFIFRMVAAATARNPEEDWGTVAVQFEYPTANNQSLPGALWMYAEKLHNQIHEAATAHRSHARKRG